MIRTHEQDTGGLRERLMRGLPVAERRVRAAGVDTAVLEGGAGSPVVLLHGHGEFGATWAPVLPALVERHRVIVPDLPGQGASEAGGTLTADRVLQWLGELIAATCAAPPVLVGHLLGGAIALRFVAGNAGRTRGLALVDSFGLAPFRPSPKFMVPMIGFLARPTERSRDRLFRKCFVDMDGVRRKLSGQLELLEAYALDRARVPAVKAALRSLMMSFALGAIPRATLAGIAVPTTLIWGRHDLQVRLKVAQSASARYGWPLHVIEDAADDPAIEQPEAFLRVLIAALGDGP